MNSKLGNCDCGNFKAHCPSARTLAAAADTAGDALEEITVTAQRRDQSIQDVPISMQALTGQALAQLNITTFDDYIKYLPNGHQRQQRAGTERSIHARLERGFASQPGKFLHGVVPERRHLPRQSIGPVANRNLDIYAADLNRIEVLEGPQGTLFGAGAEAGVIRYITNQPKSTSPKAASKPAMGRTAHGDNNADVTAVLNLPLIAEHLAVRAVLYDDHRGGYIDNVPATFTRKNTDIAFSMRTIRQSTAYARTASRTMAFVCRRGVRHSTTRVWPAAPSTP